MTLLSMQKHSALSTLSVFGSYADPSFVEPCCWQQCWQQYSVSVRGEIGLTFCVFPLIRELCHPGGSQEEQMPRQCVPNSLCLLHHRSWTPYQRIMGAPGSSRQQFIPGDLRKSRSNHPNHHGTLVGSTMLILHFPAPSRSLKTTSQKFLAAPLRCHMWARFVY